MVGNLQKNNLRYKSAGFSFVEAIIALAIFSLTITSIWIAMWNQSDGSANYLMRDNTAVLLKNIFENEFFGEELASSSPFVASVIDSPITSCLIDHKRKLSWNFNSPHLAEDSLIVSDMAESMKLENDCGGYPEYKNIHRIQPQNIPIEPGSTATGIDIVRDRYFASFLNADDPAAPDLVTGFVPAANNPTLESIDVGPGINNLDAAGDYVYGVQKSATNQLAIIDVHNPVSILVASSTLPSVAGSHPEGWSIFYYDHKVYVGTKRTAGNEFHIFDVTDPANPLWLGSKEVNHNINSIAVRNGTAFLATSGNTKDLIVLDVSNPHSITEITSINLPGNEDSKTLQLLGDTLYIGRFKSTSGNPDFYVADVSHVKTDGGISVLGTYTVGADVNAIRVANGYVYIGSSKIGGNLEVLNLSTLPNIYQVASSSLPQKITGFDFENNNFMFSTFGTENLGSIQAYE